MNDDDIITHVAIIHKDVTYSLPKPNRHHHVIKYIVEECKQTPPVSGLQGFLTKNGKFLNRTNARILAEETNQILPNADLRANILFSEDLW